MNFSLEHEC